MDAKKTGTLGKRAVAVWVVALTAVVLAWCGQGRAGTVTGEGDTGTGTLREVVASAAPGDTITFDAAVKTILLDTKVASDKVNLTITGRTGGFAAATRTLLLDYGIDAVAGTTDFSGLDPDGVDETALLAALKALPLPEVTIDGQGKTRLLEFTDDTGLPNKTTLSGMTLQNANHAFTAADDDKSGTSDASNSSANASVERTDPKAQGGAIRIAGAGELTSMAVTANALSISGGVAKGGGITGSSGNTRTYANASASGGGAYLDDDSTISSSLFHGNTASATGGGANGGTFEGNVFANAYASATAYAYAYGGGAYLVDGGTISSSLFYGNTASATGGGTNGGTFEGDVSTSASTNAYASADAHAIAYGGGAYLVDGGTISSSLFHGNIASATGGEANGGTFEGEVFSASVDAYAYAVIGASAYGGGAFLRTGGTISSSLFHGNIASATGGEANGGTFKRNVSADATASVFADAYATADGGGVYLNTGGTISSSLFHGNTASATGGGGKRRHI